jgi:hypothetical protein
MTLRQSESALPTEIALNSRVRRSDEFAVCFRCVLHLDALSGSVANTDDSHLTLVLHTLCLKLLI